MKKIILFQIVFLFQFCIAQENETVTFVNKKAEEVKETDSKDKLVAALKASFDFCSDALSKMDDSKLGETTDGGPGGQQVSRARFALGIASAIVVSGEVSLTADAGGAAGEGR